MYIFLFLCRNINVRLGVFFQMKIIIFFVPLTTLYIAKNNSISYTLVVLFFLKYFPFKNHDLEIV